MSFSGEIIGVSTITRFYQSSCINTFVWTARRGYSFHSQCVPMLYGYLYFKMAYTGKLEIFYFYFLMWATDT